MRPLPILCVCVFLVLAGCSLGPTGQEGPVTVVVNNSANETHTFEVWVVEYPANVTVRRSDGNVATGDVGPGLATHEPGPHYFTAVELPDSARLHSRYPLESNAMTQTKIEQFPADFAVVVVISHDARIVSWVSAHCDGDLVFVEVTMFEYGSGSAYNCEGGLF
ncbi:hypothetical protein [Haladaptatus sp. YSMS36]|uniref:hypothetical protein n=1 Tax=Haladaptatus sp. YSMS36 TaxID=3033384 RepID=UPI0023E77BBC|nr:hypothetical protein [Haladaptatus sp. YSMS36]